MKAISGPKAGMKQGELGGALKEAGFTEEQVRGVCLIPSIPEMFQHQGSLPIG